VKGCYVYTGKYIIGLQVWMLKFTC